MIPKSTIQSEVLLEAHAAVPLVNLPVPLNSQISLSHEFPEHHFPQDPASHCLFHLYLKFSHFPLQNLSLHQWLAIVLQLQRCHEAVVVISSCTYGVVLSRRQERLG